MTMKSPDIQTIPAVTYNTYQTGSVIRGRSGVPETGAGGSIKLQGLGARDGCLRLSHYLISECLSQPRAQATTML